MDNADHTNDGAFINPQFELPSEMSDLGFHYGDSPDTEGHVDDPVTISSRRPSTSAGEDFAHDEHFGLSDAPENLEEKVHGPKSCVGQTVTGNEGKVGLNERQFREQSGYTNGMHQTKFEKSVQRAEQVQQQVPYGKKPTFNHDPERDDNDAVPQRQTKALEFAENNHKPRKQTVGKPHPESLGRDPLRADRSCQSPVPQHASSHGLIERGRQRLGTAPAVFARSNDLSSGRQRTASVNQPRGGSSTRAAEPTYSAFTHRQVATPAASSHHAPATPCFTASRFNQPDVANRPSLIVKPKADNVPKTSSTIDLSDEMDLSLADIKRVFLRQHDAKLAEVDSKNKELQNDLRQAQSVQKVLQMQIDALQQEKLDTSEIVARQKASISAFEARAGKVKTYVDGLGRDINALQLQAIEDRRKGEQLAIESESNQETLDDLVNRVTSNAEKATELRDEALRAFQDASRELSEVKIRCAHFEEQANNNAILLAEEKSLRSQLQSQLTSSSNSSDAILRELKTTNTAVLDKLNTMHEDLEKAEGREKVHKMLENAITEVQNLSTQQTSTSKDMASVKGVVDALAESFSSASGRDTHDDHVASLKAHVDQIVTDLKADLRKYQDLVAQDASNRATINNLEEKLGESESNILKLNEQLSSAQATVNANQDYQTKLHEVELELQARSTKLASVEAELASRVQEVEKLTSDNQVLQQQADEASNAPPSISEEQIQAARSKARAEMTAYVEEIRGELQSKSENELKAISKERDKARSKAKDLKNELDAAKAQIENLQGDDSITRLQEKLDAAEDLAEKHNEEIETLRQGLFQANEKARASQESETASNIQIDNERRIAEDLQGKLQAAEQAQSEAESARDKAVADGKKEVAEYKATADAAILKAEQTSDKRIQDLQTALAQSREECQQNVAEAEKFQATFEAGLQAQEESYKQQIQELKAKLAEAESNRDEALAASKRLEVSLAKASVNPTSAQPTPKEQAIQVGGPLSGSQAAVSAQAHQTVEPSRGPVVEESQIAARFGSGGIQSSPNGDTTTAPAVQKVRGPVVEESQQPFDSMPKAPPAETQDDDPFGMLDETQQEEPYFESQQNSFPKFAAFNNRFARQSKQPSSDDSMRDITDPFHWNKTAVQPPPSSSSGLKGTQEACQVLRNQINEYSKPTATPNSGSKIVRAASDVSHLSGGQPSRAKLQTPDPHTSSRGEGFGSQNKGIPSKSSTPDFMARSQNHPKQTYGHGFGSGRKPSSSRRMSEAGQEHTPGANKRKATGQVIEGYEQERKKRLNAAASAKGKQQAGVGAEPKSQGSMSLSQGASQTAYGQAGGRGGPSTSRTQKTAGGASRTTRSSKGKKNDHFNTRFQQELNGR